MGALTMYEEAFFGPAIVGFLGALAAGLLIALIVRDGPYLAVAVPLGVLMIGDLVLARRTDSWFKRWAGVGFALGCAGLMVFFLGGA